MSTDLALVPDELTIRPSQVINYGVYLSAALQMAFCAAMFALLRRYWPMLSPIFLAIPQGYEVQVRPRSGLAAKAGITCLNTPGTIDSDYRGEVKVILINLGAEDFTIRRGDRIAQMVVAPVAQAGWIEVDDLDETARGAGGFGSTGHG